MHHGLEQLGRPRLLTAAPRSVGEGIARVIGSAIADERPARSGFTHAVASWIRSRNGGTVFVKAGPQDTDGGAGVRIGAELSPVIGDLGPELIGLVEADGWVAAVYEAIIGDPLTTWDAKATAALADLSQTLRTRLDPAPIGDTEPYAAAFSPLLGTWQALSSRDHPDGETVAHVVDRPLPYGLDASVLARLESQWFDALTPGSTALQHGDLRRDNVVRDRSGRLWLVDWTHRWIAPGWVDLVRVAPDIAASGQDPERFLRSTVWSDAPPEAVDVVLAGLAGRAWRDGHRADVPGVPHLRAMQREQGDMTLRWLASRLGTA